MTIKRYLLLGAGDLAREVARILEANAAESGEICEIAVYSDNPSNVAPQFSRHCSDGQQALLDFPPSTWEAIGCVGSPRVRALLYAKFRDLGYRFATACHSHATVFADQIGPGCVIFPGVRLAVGVRLGEDVLVNFNASIGHDCVLGAHSCISPSVSLGGRIHSGKRVMFGIGSSVVQGRRIEDDAVIAAGSSVWTHVAAGATMMGVPAAARKMPGSAATRAKAASAAGQDSELVSLSKAVACES